nr:protein CDC73 homolog [Ipomoea batatas]
MEPLYLIRAVNEPNINEQRLFVFRSLTFANMFVNTEISELSSSSMEGRSWTPITYSSGCATSLSNIEYIFYKIKNGIVFVQILSRMKLPPFGAHSSNISSAMDPLMLLRDNGNAYVEGNVMPDAGVLENQNPIEMIRAMEKPLRDRESILLSKNRDFYTVLTAAVRRDEERQRAEALQRKDGLVAKSRLERGMGYGGGEDMGYDGATKTKIHLKGSKIGEGVPIILVPSAFSTLITIYNVKEFLEDGVYIPTDVKLKQMNGQKPECVTVQKKFSRDRVVTAYEVRDKPSALKTEDWDRVVAVFVLGKEWQFKDWPFKDHVEIFNKVIGFYLRFEDDSVESAKTVKQWNVKIISVSKNKRHQDRAAALEVWDKLEEFMRSRSR